MKNSKNSELVREIKRRVKSTMNRLSRNASKYFISKRCGNKNFTLSMKTNSRKATNKEKCKNTISFLFPDIIFGRNNTNARK